MRLFLMCMFALTRAKCGLCELNAFHKCCPDNQSLAKVTGENETSIFQCIESTKLEYEISISPLIISKDIKTSYGMPDQCGEDEIEDYKIERMVELTHQKNGCYDVLVLETQNGKIIDEVPKIVCLKCKVYKIQNTTNHILNIDRVRKCCPAKHVYDVVNKACTKINEDIDEKWLVKLLQIKNVGPRIFEVNTGIRCKQEAQYTIDLMSDEFSLDVYGSNLNALRKTMAEERQLREGDWCMDRRNDNSELVARICTSNALAFGAYPIRKCCPVGKHFKVKRCTTMVSDCVPNTDYEFTFNMSMYLDSLKKKNNAFPDLLGIRSSLRCPKGKYVTDKEKWDDQHSLNLDGTLQLMRGKEDNYCLEEFDRRHCHDENPIVVSAIACFVNAPPVDRKDFYLSFALNTISAVCLAVTLLVYIIVPELRTLHGRILVCHTGTMLLGFSFLARVQYGPVENHLCTVFGYIIYFGFVAAFAWLNVMCLDIWWTFGSVRTVHPLRNFRENVRRFLWYSSYAWSFAIVMTLATFLLDKYPVAVILDAEIGMGTCWFNPKQNTYWPHYIFFVIPMGLLTCANFVLWVMTARHCARVKSELRRLQAGSAEDRAECRFRIDKDKHILTGKLFVVMGAGWLTETLSTVFTDPEWLWKIVDCINQLQGLFLFIILIMKPKYYYIIRKRLNRDYSQAMPLQNCRRTD